MLSELLLLSLAATPAQEPRPYGDDCRATAPRDAVVDAGAALRVRVEALAGSLRIEGRPGVTSVTVRGRACALTEALLGQVGLDAVREGGDVLVRARLPEARGWWGDGRAWLDLVLEVPDTLPLIVGDGSGAARIRGIASLDVTDGSGELVVEDVSGDVRIHDGSGALHVRDVAGAVRIRDGSGGIEVRSVGSLTVEADGSGSIGVEAVRGDVRVRRDGSGAIDVRDVDGDLIVGPHGAGGVRHRDVRGRVAVPASR
jgi:hypothetical protein